MVHELLFMISILVSTFAPKFIRVFGLVSNSGNIYYGSLFGAIILLVELYGKKEGYRGFIRIPFIYVGILCKINQEDFHVA